MDYGFINSDVNIKKTVVLPKEYFKVHPEDPLCKLKEEHLKEHED